MDIKIEILLSTYNDTDFLSDLLLSLKNQTYNDFTLTIRDDGSNLDTIQLIENEIKDFKKVNFIKSTKNIGFFNSYNLLIEQCAGDLIFLCDQDDIWHLNKVEVILNEYLKNLHLKIPILFYSDLILINYKNQSFSKSYFENINFKPDSIRSLLFLRNSIPGCSIAFNSVLKNIYITLTKVVPLHDHILIILAIFYGNIIFVPDALIYYRMHARNTIGIRKTGILDFYQNLKLVIRSDRKYSAYLNLKYSQILFQIEIIVNMKNSIDNQNNPLIKRYITEFNKHEYSIDYFPILPRNNWELIIVKLLK